MICPKLSSRTLLLWMAASLAACGGGGGDAAAPRAAPAPALAWNNRLTQAAEAHAQDMAANDFFSHTGSGGSTLGSRVSAAGYDWRSLGENIAAGQTGIHQVVDGWIASEGHCANLLNPAFSEVGLSCVSGTPATTYRSYWTMDLGAPR